MPTLKDAIHVGRGMVYDPATQALHLGLYDRETSNNLIGVGERIGDWTFHLVQKRWWYSRFLTWFIGSEYEHPFNFPTKSSVDKFLRELTRIAPGVDFWITGNPIAPASDRDRVMLWAQASDGSHAGPFDVGERMYDLWHRRVTAETDIRNMLQSAGVRL